MSTSLTQLNWPASFACTIITEDVILPTTYNISIIVDTVTDSHADIAVGFKKIKSFIDLKLHNSIFVSANNEILPALSKVSNTLTIFPTDPYDFFVGCVLFKKFLTISEKYFTIDFLTIDSLVGDHIQYTILDPDESGLNLDGNNWWNMDTLDTGSGSNINWDDLNITVGPKFSPKIIQGGLSGNQ